MARVLVVDDEPAVRRALERALALERHDVVMAGDGEEALDALVRSPPDAVILDVMMPRLDGLEVCRRMRAAGDKTPILMLTARDAIDDRVQGLDVGADDYLVKPFALSELHARLRSLVRRGAPERPTVLRVGGLRLDPARREVRRGESEIDLSAKEFVLLHALMRRPGEVLTRLELIEQAWDFAYENRSNVVDVYIRRLRRKVDEPFGTDSLETVRGAGYRLRDG
jgi:two-component system OmpR family response regulator